MPGIKAQKYINKYIYKIKEEFYTYIKAILCTHKYEFNSNIFVLRKISRTKYQKA